MRLLSLETSCCRNLADTALPFSDGVNLLIGKNAAGKTNTLECAYYFAAGRSFRTRSEREMIKNGCDTARMTLRFAHDSDVSEFMTAAFRKDGAKGVVKRLTCGNTEVARLSEFLGNFRAVLFTPDHLSLIKGSPEERRRFLDMALAQIAPSYAVCMNRYNKLLEQKNAYLKRIVGGGTPDTTYLDTVNTLLADAAAVIVRQRTGFVGLLAGYAASYYTSLSAGHDTLEIRYLSPLRKTPFTSQEDAKTALYRVYCEDMASEQRLGYTFHGPHKDDLAVYIAKDGETELPDVEEETAVSRFNARSFGSQGEQRSAVLAMKLAEGEICREKTGEYPVFLLDDLLGELDRTRREQLLSLISGRQTVITCCDIDAFPPGVAAKVIHVENGNFRTES